MRHRGFWLWGIQTGQFAACWTVFVPEFFHLFTQPPIINHFCIMGREEGRKELGQKIGKGNSSKVNDTKHIKLWFRYRPATHAPDSEINTTCFWLSSFSFPPIENSHSEKRGNPSRTRTQALAVATGAADWLQRQSEQQQFSLSACLVELVRSVDVWCVKGNWTITKDQTKSDQTSVNYHTKFNPCKCYFLSFGC